MRFACSTELLMIPVRRDIRLSFSTFKQQTKAYLFRQWQTVSGSAVAFLCTVLTKEAIFSYAIEYIAYYLCAYGVIILVLQPPTFQPTPTSPIWAKVMLLPLFISETGSQKQAGWRVPPPVRKYARSNGRTGRNLDVFGGSYDGQWRHKKANKIVRNLFFLI